MKQGLITCQASLAKSLNPYQIRPSGFWSSFHLFLLHLPPVIRLQGLIDADHGCNDPREERVTATPVRFHGEAMAGLEPFRLGEQPTTDQS